MKGRFAYKASLPFLFLSFTYLINPVIIFFYIEGNNMTVLQPDSHYTQDILAHYKAWSL